MRIYGGLVSTTLCACCKQITRWVLRRWVPLAPNEWMHHAMTNECSIKTECSSVWCPCLFLISFISITSLCCSDKRIVKHRTITLVSCRFRVFHIHFRFFFISINHSVLISRFSSLFHKRLLSVLLWGDTIHVVLSYTSYSSPWPIDILRWVVYHLQPGGSTFIRFSFHQVSIYEIHFFSFFHFSLLHLFQLIITVCLWGALVLE